MRVDPWAPTRSDERPEASVERSLGDDLDRLGQVVEHLPVVAYTMHRDGSHQDAWYVSGGIERLTGYTPEEWLADAGLWSLVIHPEDRDAAVALWQRTLDAGVPYDHEYRMVRRDGGESWVREQAAATTRQGHLHVDGIFEDVTDRRLAQDRLAAAEQRTRDLIEQVPAIFYEEEPGAAGVTSYVSPQIMELLGVSPETYVADRNWWIDHLHPEDRDRVLPEDDARLEDRNCRSAVTSEYRLVTDEGRTVWINDRATIIRGDDGAAVLVRGCMFDITPQKVAEAKVADGEARYRTLVERLPLITYLWEVDPVPGDDPSYYTSPQIGSILGYTAEEWHQDPEGWREMIHPEDHDRVMEASGRSESSGEPFVEEYRYLHGVDGRPVWVHDESVMLRRDDEGRPWLFQGVMYDITARVEADLALEGSLARFRALANDAPIGIFENDLEGRCTFVNDLWCRAAGMVPEAAMGYGWAEAVHPDDRATVQAAWTSAIATDRDFLSEFRFRHPDGAVRWVSARATAVRDASGTPTGFLGTVDDMTDRRATEEQLRLIRSAIEHTGHGVMVVALGDGDDVSPVVYVNPAYSAMTGYDVEDVMGRPPTTFLEPQDHTAIRGRLRGGEDQTLEVEMIRKDGSRFTAEGVVSPIRDPAGSSSHVVVILRDVTEIREVERSLRGSIEELRRTDRDRRAALAQIVEGQEQELQRMAEGIEDRSLQDMTAVRMRMETLRRNLSDPAQLRALDKLEGSVDVAVGQLRGLVSDLRPRELGTDGLAGAIRQHLGRSCGELRARIVGALEEEPDPPQAAAAFRIVQEALASAVHDRAARTLRIELADATDGFCVLITDDGASWTTDRPQTMQDRASLAGGRCHLSDGADGATAELWLPLHPPVAGRTPPPPS